ncbi:hypothetical protein ITI46_18205 [Streptomyces oryzae]|uniref:Small hydrophobic protein n=1 Tax=Streptomyces oryzae TaxID=1434886 RepID=A0ABS3XDW0_9ACTN|nr:DUF6126 family protein [Streptomyces oryzae]MBO8193578.1 hypothetical protein [Streptomyces oryzae]
MTAAQPPEPQPSPAAAPTPTAAPSPAPSPAAPSPGQADPRPRRREQPGEERGDGRFPRGLALRLFVYVVAGHLLAGFLFLLFELGGGK